MDSCRLAHPEFPWRSIKTHGWIMLSGCNLVLADFFDAFVERLFCAHAFSHVFAGYFNLVVPQCFYLDHVLLLSCLVL